MVFLNTYPVFHAALIFFDLVIPKVKDRKVPVIIFGITKSFSISFIAEKVENPLTLVKPA